MSHLFQSTNHFVSWFGATTFDYMHAYIVFCCSSLVKENQVFVQNFGSNLHRFKLLSKSREYSMWHHIFQLQSKSLWNSILVGIYSKGRDTIRRVGTVLRGHYHFHREGIESYVSWITMRNIGGENVTCGFSYRVSSFAFTLCAVCTFSD